MSLYLHMKHQTSKVFKWMNKCWLLLKAKQAKSTVKHNEKSKPVGFRGVSIHIYIIRQINKQINRWLVNSANKSITICIHICAYLSPPKWWFSSLLEFLTSLHCSIFFSGKFSLFRQLTFLSLSQNTSWQSLVFPMRCSPELDLVLPQTFLQTL